MDSLGNDAIAILQYLLPGFLAAWIFYGFTPYVAPSQFERIVQALIFTLFINAGVRVERLLWPDLAWDDSELLFAATLTAFVVGAAFSWGANSDRFHALMRAMHITKETSQPSEWFGAFQRNEDDGQRYIVLHFKDKRRLYGWPRIWPTQPGEGHFIIEKPSWLTAGREEQRLSNVFSIMVSVKDVRWVEFVKKTSEMSNG